jgi:hypothetical protein
VTRLFIAAGILTCYPIALWPRTPAYADATVAGRPRFLGPRWMPTRTRGIFKPSSRSVTMAAACSGEHFSSTAPTEVERARKENWPSTVAPHQTGACRWAAFVSALQHRTVKVQVEVLTSNAIRWSAAASPSSGASSGYRGIGALFDWHVGST